MQQRNRRARDRGAVGLPEESGLVPPKVRPLLRGVPEGGLSGFVILRPTTAMTRPNSTVEMSAATTGKTTPEYGRELVLRCRPTTDLISECVAAPCLLSIRAT